MAHRQSGGYKEEPGVAPPGDHHHPHHAPQGPPSHHLQQPRPSSVVHQHHHQQAPPPQSHSSAYPPSHGLPQYSQPAPGPGGQHQQDLPYYASHPSPYSTPSASGTYSSAEAPEIMAAAQMSSRPYPPITYHTPQSNSPASVASPSAHEHRLYGQPPSQMQQSQQQMYYSAPQQQYAPPMPPQNGPSPYPQHPQQHPQQHPSMTSQPNLLMSHAASQQHQMQQQHPSQQHPSQQHPSQQQHTQPGMTGSPRTKMEPHVPQNSRPPAPLGPVQHSGNGPQMNQNSVPGPQNGVNPNAAPGPIPATTPLVVRQDNNGVQWIAFEYSRDRVKMEYTIRCDVESVNVDHLNPEFKTENCVYPRACCSKDQYRGNRLVYETECNTVGWALAELNACLRGKRGLIQRAVDSWRNSNQDPRLRSRRVRRMAKISTRKATQASHPPHMAGPGGPPGMPAPASMGPGGAGNMGKPSMSGMGGQQLHHHHAQHPDGSAQGGDDVEDEYMDENTHHHHQTASNGPPANGPQEDVRQSHVFPGYSGSYPPNPSVIGASMPPSLHDPRTSMHQSPPHPISARSKGSKEQLSEEDRKSLFGDIPEAKKRKFILVDDPGKGGRVRVRVTLDTVDINEIPDSFRKSNSVYPRSWFPMQMQSPPPSARGSRFFENEDEDDIVEVEGTGRERGRKFMVSVPLADGGEAEMGVPKMRKSVRSKEVKLNDLGYRMTWHQSRVFADKTIFLQKALDSYRNKVHSTMESVGQDVADKAPHFETRVGKRRWVERSKRGKGDA